MNQAQAVSTSSIPAVRPDSDAVRERLQGSRRRMNLIALTASLGAMAFGLFWLAWILWTTISLGVGGLSIDLFTQMTPAPNTAGGGLANAEHAFEIANAADFIRLVRPGREQARAAMIATQHVGVAQQVHVAANGLRSHAEMLGERIDAHFAMLAK